MDEQDLREAYARLAGSLAPPVRAQAVVGERITRRRRRRTAVAAVAAVLAVAGTTTAAVALRDAPSGRPSVVADPTPAPPARLTCASGNLVESGGGFLATFPVRTDPAAVAAPYLRPGERVDLRRLDREARVLVVRPDGTARAALTLPRTDGGWTWSGEATTCADGGRWVVPTGADAADQVTCGDRAEQVAAGRVVNPVAGTGAANAVELGQQWRGDPGWEIAAAGAVTPDRELVTVTDHRGRVRASLETARDDGVWRVVAFAACPSDVPGLPAHEGVDAVALPYGHCWIGTLELDGRRWQVRDEDQFGWGGGGPADFRAVGTARVDGEVLTYVDASGHRLGLVPEDTPGTEVDQGPCA